MGFPKPSRDRLHAELRDALKASDIQLTHSLIYTHGGSADDFEAAATGADVDVDAIRAEYCAWADEMRGDDVAFEIPRVLTAITQTPLPGLDVPGRADIEGIHA